MCLSASLLLMFNEISFINYFSLLSFLRTQNSPSITMYRKSASSPSETTVQFFLKSILSSIFANLLRLFLPYFLKTGISFKKSMILSVFLFSMSQFALIQSNLFKTANQHSSSATILAALGILVIIDSSPKLLPSPSSDTFQNDNLLTI